jgi:hypothetical protein
MPQTGNFFRKLGRILQAPAKTRYIEIYKISSRPVISDRHKSLSLRKEKPPQSEVGRPRNNAPKVPPAHATI